MAEFKVGDVVRLKSGGPKMTVIGIEKPRDGATIFACAWFAGQDKDRHEEGSFPHDALVEAAESPERRVFQSRQAARDRR